MANLLDAYKLEYVSVYTNEGTLITKVSTAKIKTKDFIPKEAVEVLEKVVALSRPEDVIYEAIGHCYHKMGKIAQARFYYKKAVTIRFLL